MNEKLFATLILACTGLIMLMIQWHAHYTMGDAAWFDTLLLIMLGVYAGTILAKIT